MVTRVIKFLLLGFVTAFCYTLAANATSIFGIAPNYGTIIIFLIIMRREYVSAYPAVFMVGLIIDSLNPETMGLGTAIRFTLAVALYEIKQHVDTEQPFVRLYLLIYYELLFQLVYHLLINSFDFGTVTTIYLETAAPTFVYTVVLGFVIVMLSDLSLRLYIRKRDFA